MMPQPPPRRAEESWNIQHGESLLQRGVAAVKAGQMEEARNFLEPASRRLPMDPRPWLWLSATTEVQAERCRYLEQALAIDPTNQAARRGLVALSGRAEPMLPEGVVPSVRAPDSPVRGQAQSFRCPQCGGQTRYDPPTATQRCDSCGTLTPLDAANVASDRFEQKLDFVLPTARAHRWAAAAHALDCQQCGAASLLPAGQRSHACAYCGSEQLVASDHTVGLLEPQGILPMVLNERAAQEAIGRWQRTGWLRRAPGSAGLRLRPAYVPAWTFDATLYLRWTCRVQVSKNRWEPREGSAIEMFDDVWVPGIAALPLEALNQLTPFEYGALVEFREEFLVGWPALLYDRSLADASIQARGEMARRVRETLEEKTLIDKEKRDFRVIPTGTSDQSYRQILVPLWIGHYEQDGQRHELIVNGQSGTVWGKKPLAPARVALAVALALVLVGALLAAFLVLR